MGQSHPNTLNENTAIKTTLAARDPGDLEQLRSLVALLVGGATSGESG